ncbi:hypothetical protein F2Q68_00025009 [Brassica cretica]|uniref:Arabidopsis retrotransposon Orf1 C-terminal domain-containing protein n=1 Tax=Brassica cretica TaxID=69181 RepID=A0A8S9IFM4_BRACR|nr:hypothetical protein F2Q68_00025009 [Brassica cretica]
MNPRNLIFFLLDSCEIDYGDVGGVDSMFLLKLSDHELNSHLHYQVSFFHVLILFQGKKSKAQEKRDEKQVAIVEKEVVGGKKSAPPKRAKEPKGKGAALPQVEDSEDITKEDQAPLKKGKMSKAKEADVERDRTKKSTESELFEHLKNGVFWPPTRFADIKIMEELEIDEDIKSILEHMNMQSFFSMAHPTYEEVSCQFLASLEATFHTSKHVRQGWGKINSRSMRRKRALPNLFGRCWRARIARPTRDKNAFIRHSSVHYLHRLIVHTIFPRKEPGTVNDEELQLLHQTVQHYASPPQLPLVSTDFYKTFGMVGFFVKRLIHYKEWAWTTSDSEPHIGIGGLITPLLEYKDISLGDDATGPPFLDGSYLKKVLQWKPGAISFDIGEEHFLAPHSPLGPMSSPKKKKTADKCGMYQEDTSGLNSELLYGPPRYHFEQRPGALASGPLRQAHEHIGNLQRWNKAQDRTIFKLKDKCKELSKTVKRQAEASAQFMKKVADILNRGAVAGCSTSDFDFLTPQP